MSEMMERVARAIRETRKNCGQLPVSALGDPDSSWAVDPSILEARAAIAAMREPTISMPTKGAQALDARQSGLLSTPEATRVWRAMIDEALR